MTLVITTNDINNATQARLGKQYRPLHNCPAGQALRRRFKNAQKIEVGITEIRVDDRTCPIPNRLRLQLKNWDRGGIMMKSRYSLEL